MTPEQRADVVELLRCAHDVSQWLGYGYLSLTAERIHGKANCETHLLAYAAAKFVYDSHARMPFVDCLLEAAQLVEEGVTVAMTERSIENDATHEWSATIAPLWDVCAKCGVVRRADRMHRPCPGKPPQISPRAHRCNGGKP